MCLPLDLHLLWGPNTVCIQTLNLDVNFTDILDKTVLENTLDGEYLLLSP